MEKIQITHLSREIWAPENIKDAILNRIGLLKDESI